MRASVAAHDEVVPRLDEVATRLFAQLGIVSLFHRYRLTSLITSTAPQPIGLRVGGNLRRAMSCMPSIITVIGLLHD
jgi:hypothetical protein